MVPEFTGRIVEWDVAKGCGWVESEGQRIFLHRRDFAERRKRPAVGDRIRFTAGTGPTGRLCAQDAVHLDDGGRFGVGAGLLLLALLVLPALAVARLGIDPRIAGAYALVTSIIAYVAYAADKARARRKQWRIPESTLHSLEAIGGWPGAFIAQRRLRHKCTKRSYQAVFWLIVGVYQYLALDFLNRWELSIALAEKLKALGG